MPNRASPTPCKPRTPWKGTSEEVFDGDAGRMAAATFDSRQMISDVLRRGLDVSVREPTPVRQIEPIHATPELER